MSLVELTSCASLDNSSNLLSSSASYTLTPLSASSVMSSLTPPVKSTRASERFPASRASYEPCSLDNQSDQDDSQLSFVLLGISFLQERGPPLVLVLAVGERWAPVLGGYEVINKNLLPTAEPPEVEFENSAENVCDISATDVGITYLHKRGTVSHITITCISPACRSPTPDPRGQG